MADIIFGEDWFNVIGSLVLITFVFATGLVIAAGYMYRKLESIQNNISLITSTMDPPKRHTFLRAQFNAGYDPEIPRVMGGSSLHDRSSKFEHTFDTGAPSLARERDDPPYNIPRPFPSSRDGDTRGNYPNKMTQDSYLNQFRRN